MKTLLLTVAVLLSQPTAAAESIEERLQEFLDFATYTEGAITPAQVMGAGLDQFEFIDTRSAAQYAAARVPGARNIEWREVVARRDDIPADRSVVLYCDTGLLSSKAHLALRLLGYDENLKVMFGGFNGWIGEGGTVQGDP